MIDLRTETILTLTKAAERLGVTRKTIYGWAKGIRGRRLETAKLGGWRITSLEALQRFSEQDDDTLSLAAYDPHLAARKANFEAAMRELEARSARPHRRKQ